MKKAIITITLIIIISGIFAENKVFKLNYDNYKPFHWKTANGEDKGIFIDIIKEALEKRLDLKVEYSEYPWARAQLNVKMGFADAFITTPTPERLKYIKVGDEPIIVMKKVAYTQKNNPNLEKMMKINSISDMNPYQLVDYLGNGWAKQNLSNLNILWVEDPDKVLEIMSKGQGDIFVESPIIIDFILNKMNKRDLFVRLPVIFDRAPFNLCIEKTSEFTRILPELDKVLKEMKDDGFIQRTLKKYK